MRDLYTSRPAVRSIAPNQSLQPLVCGSTVYYTSDAMEGYVAIPVGAFADPQFPGPTLSVYEERMHSWVSMPSDIEHIA